MVGYLWYDIYSHLSRITFSEFVINSLCLSGLRFRNFGSCYIPCKKGNSASVLFKVIRATTFPSILCYYVTAAVPWGRSDQSGLSCMKLKQLGYVKLLLCWEVVLHLHNWGLCFVFKIIWFTYREEKKNLARGGVK